MTCEYINTDSIKQSGELRYLNTTEILSFELASYHLDVPTFQILLDFIEITGGKF